MENGNVDYANKYKKQVKALKKQRCVLLILLATSLGIGGYHAHKDDIKYNRYTYENYYHLVNDNIYTRVNAGEEVKIINAYELAKDVKEINFKNRKEFYHCLIGIVNNIDYQKEQNFKDFVIALGLDSLAEENPIYPSTAEFKQFLDEYNLLKEDGTIDFNKWKEIDKELVNIEESVGKNK